MLAPGWVMASEMSERLACMEALSKFENGAQAGKITVDFSSDGRSYFWDGKSIFEQEALTAKEIWSAARFREKGDGRLNSNFPSREIERIQEYVIKISFSDLLSNKVDKTSVAAVDGYFERCKRVTDVTIRGKGAVAKLAEDKMHEFRLTKEFATVFAHEPKQEASAGK